MINNRKFWSWAGKLALIAVPALISGVTSYMKSKVEAEATGKASYETLQKAFVDLHEDFDALQKRTEGLEGQLAEVRKEKERPVLLRAPPVMSGPPLVLSAPDAGTGSIGIGSIGVMGHGIGSSKPVLKKKHLDLPEKFEDAVQQYKVEQSKK